MEPLDGRFELLERLSDQGYGEAWRARDLQVRNRVVTLKRLGEARADASLDATLRQLKGFRHGGVLALLHHGAAGGRPYVVHELFEGPSLAAELARTWREGDPLPRAMLERLAEKLCDALDAAHALLPPLVHGGLRPGCVLLRRASPQHFDLRIVDFGVAPFAAPPQDPSRGGALGASVAGRASVAGDVAALGRVLRAMLASPASPGEDPAPEGRDWRRDDVPDAVWAVVERSTSPRPEARFADVDALRRALESAWACAVEGPAARPPAAPVIDAPPATPEDDAATVLTPRFAPPPAEGTALLEAAWVTTRPAEPADDATVLTARRSAPERTAEWSAAALAKAAPEAADVTDVAFARPFEAPRAEPRATAEPRAPARVGVYADENPWATEVRLRPFVAPAQTTPAKGPGARWRAWIVGALVALIVGLAAFAMTR